MSWDQEVLLESHSVYVTGSVDPEPGLVPFPNALILQGSGWTLPSQAQFALMGFEFFMERV